MSDDYFGFTLVRPEIELCEGTVDHLNTFVEQTFEFLGAPIPPRFYVPIIVGDEAICSGGSACYSPSSKSIYLKGISHLGLRSLSILRHELIHAIAHQLWGSSIPFFSEGLADAFGRIDLTGSFNDDTIAESLDKPANELNYYLAATFTRFLLDTYGVDAYRQIYQRSNGRNNAEIRKILEDVTGLSFLDLLADFMAEPTCQYQLDVCDAALATPVTSGISWTRAARCADPASYGGTTYSGFTLFGQHEVVEIQTAGRYRVFIEFSAPLVGMDYLFSGGMLHRCGDCSEQQSWHWSMLTNSRILDLEPGIYVLEFWTIDEQDMHFGLELLPSA